MQPIILLVLLGLACQNSLGMSLQFEGMDDGYVMYTDIEKILAKLEAVEKHEAEQKVISSKILSSQDNILEKLAKLENQIAEQKDAQHVENMEDLQIPTEGSMIDEIDVRLLENFVKIGSKYYHIENDEAIDWFGALGKCKSLNGSLLSLKSEGEWNAITTRLNKHLSYWVDINDLQKEGEFISETSGKAAAFFKWDIAEPNNMAFSINNENCVELRSEYNHYMNDINCFAENYYICEAKLDN